MRLILDEMHSPHIADRLADESFDVITVAAEPRLRGMSDEDLLGYASSHERALVTENVADFLPLASQWTSIGRAHSGVILTNPQRFNRATLSYPGNLVVALRGFLTDPPIGGESWIWWL